MKNIYKQPGRLEWMSFLLSLPVMSVWLNYVLLGDRAFVENKAWLVSYPIVILTVLITGLVQAAVMQYTRLFFPSMQQMVWRVAVQSIAVFAIAISFSLALMLGYDRTGLMGYQFNSGDVKVMSWTALALTLIAVSIWEAEYTLAKLKERMDEKERMERARIEEEFETLKHQVNPHFLFNCFNTLSSLISEDRKQAEVFLNELSKVYRYLLRNNEDGLSLLQTEIRFIESYYRLLQTRHGDAVQLHISIDDKYEQHLLPTLSLQLLVENAVKHNVLSKNYPLKIEIFNVGSQLLVSNNLQLRSQKAPSNKVGLQNIADKYNLLQQHGFQVLQDQRSFTVALPLIKKHATTKALASQKQEAATH